ncbi:MAG: hypothetical protein Q8Q59_04145 [Luteolibacter sp.]|jgi:hypothetical protein|nr:hypothetical protein [Luteolibacter sp.]
MKGWRWLLILPPILACGGLWWFRAPLAAWVRSTTSSVEMGVRMVPKPDPKTYAVLVSELQVWRKDLATRHQRARGEEERAAVERDARLILELALPEMMRCWLGTPYDFNGTAAVPGGGRIACGYYVATVLMDAGFQVDRYQLAQQPSENILRSFLEKDACRLSVGQPYAAFATDLGHAEPGIYLVGLDTHVAFAITGAGGGFRFIHASGSRPWCVVDEGRDEALVLQRSNWRMLGNLTADPTVIRRWLKAEKIFVRGA